MMGQAMVDSAFSAPARDRVGHRRRHPHDGVRRAAQERREFRDVKVSPLLVLARACMLAMRRTPEVNSFWDDAAQEIVFKSYVNLGIAAATPRGLVVPNVKDAERLSLLDLASALNQLTATARDGKTQPAEMSGGTFTITNVGVFGVDAGTPIINPGESAILCFGAVKKQPWVVRRRDRGPSGHPARALLRPPSRRRGEGLALPRRRGWRSWRTPRQRCCSDRTPPLRKGNVCPLPEHASRSAASRSGSAAFTAVDDLSFTVEPGRITGFLGPNGAGKTTTLRMALGLIRPTSGSVTIDGQAYSRPGRPARHRRGGARGHRLPSGPFRT